MGYDLKMRIWRGDADGGDLGDFNVAVEEGEVVLDAIHRLQATQAGDLAVRMAEVYSYGRIVPVEAATESSETPWPDSTLSGEADL